MGKIRLYKRLLGLLLLAFLLLSVYNVIGGYWTSERQLRQITLERLQGIARQLASVVDGDQHQQVSSHFRSKDDIKFKQDCPDYFQIHQQLSAAHKHFNLNSPVYTFVKSEQAGKLEFICTSSEKPYFRHTYSSFPEEEFTKLELGGTIDLYKDEFGHWMSAYAPIKNSEGAIVGYLQADEKFDVLLATLRKQTLISAALNVLGLGLISLLIIPMLQKIVRQEERQKTRLAQSLAEITLLSKELQKNEETLRQNAVELEQSNQHLNDFAHIASHDLKAPIRSILSFSQLLERKLPELNKDNREYLNFIINNARRAQQLITGLLSYSTADKGVGDGQLFEMQQAVDEACLGLTAVLEERNVRMEVGELPTLQGNQVLISQVLQNLISNGIKYNQSPHPVISLGMGTDGKRGHYFFVRDNGIGIPEKYQEDIFKMFRRLHNNSSYEGSGIGLAFCTRVINSYGGEIWLESVPDEGSTFYFTLPDALRSASQPDINSAQRSA